MTYYEIVAGWTSPLDVELLTKGESPTGTMADMSAELILYDPNTGVTLNTTGDVTIPNAALWSVRYTPDSSDLVTGVYRGRFKITDSLGGVAYFPSGEWDIWRVWSET